jgi:hypothetical protein
MSKKGNKFMQIVWLDAETIAYIHLLSVKFPVLQNLAMNERIAKILKIAVSDEEIAKIIMKKLEKLVVSS